MMAIFTHLTTLPQELQDVIWREHFFGLNRIVPDKYDSNHIFHVGYLVICAIDRNSPAISRLPFPRQVEVWIDCHPQGPDDTPQVLYTDNLLSCGVMYIRNELDTFITSPAGHLAAELNDISLQDYMLSTEDMSRDVAHRVLEVLICDDRKHVGDHNQYICFRCKVQGVLAESTKQVLIEGVYPLRNVYG